MTSQMADHVAKAELEPLRGSVEAVAIVVVGAIAAVLIGAVTVMVTVAAGIIRPH